MIRNFEAIKESVSQIFENGDVKVSWDFARSVRNDSVSR